MNRHFNGITRRYGTITMRNIKKGKPNLALNWLQTQVVTPGFVQQIKITRSVMILSVKQMEYYIQTCIKRHSAGHFCQRQELTIDIEVCSCFAKHWQVDRSTRGMLFLPERHLRCFYGSFKQPGLFRSINIFRDHNDLLHLLLTFKQQLQEDSYFADPLLKLVDETALLKERIFKRLVVLSVYWFWGFTLFPRNS